MWNLSSDIHFHFHNESIDICAEPWEGSFNVIEEVLMTIGYAILIVFSFFGNAFVIAIFHKQCQLRTPVNYFIVNMAVSDLLIPLFVLPRRIKEVYFGWSAWSVGGVMGEILCKVVNYSDVVSVTVSSQSMVFIAAERFWSIVFPMKSRTAPRFICFTWMFSFTVFVYYFVAYKLDAKGFCVYDLPEIFVKWEDLWRLDRMILFVTFVAIPFVLITVFYVGILVSLHRKGKSFPHLASEPQRVRAKENRRVALMLITVVVLFFMPYYIDFFYRILFFCLKHVMWLEEAVVSRLEVHELPLYSHQPLDILHIQHKLSSRVSRIIMLPAALSSCTGHRQSIAHRAGVELQAVS